MANDLQPKHYVFIINPMSGTRFVENWPERIRQAFQDQPYGHSFEILKTEYKGHATRIAADLAAKYGEDLIVIACGGDGTSHEIVNGLANTPAVMGILPLGTANDFAKAALSSTDPNKILPKLIQPDTRPIDVFQVDGRICLNITSLGFDTKVLLQANALSAKARWLGKFSYQLAVLISLFGGREYPMHYQIKTINDQGQPETVEADARFILAAICNGRFYGGGFNPAPQARLDDGLLDFSIVESLPLRRIIPLIPLYKQGRHLGDPAVHCWKITAGIIRATSGKLLGNYDGEPFEKDRIEFQIMPSALRFAFC